MGPPPTAWTTSFENNPVLFGAYQIAHRRGVDETEVLAWPMGRFQRWLAFYRRLDRLEREAMDEATRKAQASSGHR